MVGSLGGSLVRVLGVKAAAKTIEHVLPARFCPCCDSGKACGRKQKGAPNEWRTSLNR